MVYLASVFFGLSHVNNSSRLVDLYSKTLKIIVDGEYKDILFERFGRDDENFVVTHRYRDISRDAYFKMIYQKTAVLLQASCKAGALCANASDEQVEIIGDFGLNIGMAFQIRDDILDIFGDEKEFGKKIGKDIIEKKMGNFIILSAIEQLEPGDKDAIHNIIGGSNEVSDEDVVMVTDLIKKTGAKMEAEDIANSYIQKAFDALGKLPQNEYSETLEEVAKYIVDRKN
jgi:geranylgeranyl diphosphate synthase type I